MTTQQINALLIAEELRKAGVTLAGAAGIIANLEAESALNPDNVEDRSGIGDVTYTSYVDNGTYKDFVTDAYGYGLAQWTYWSRKENLLNFARRMGVSIGNLYMQVAFLIQELQTDYKALWNMVCVSNLAGEVGERFCKEFERPANMETLAVQRGNRAEYWYGFLSENSGITVEPPGRPEPVEQLKTDEDGLEIPQTWPPRTIDEHCSEWPEVWLIQAALKCRGYYVLVDGIFGELLKKKVIAFQAANGLDADGAVGPNTWRTLLNLDKN